MRRGGAAFPYLYAQQRHGVGVAGGFFSRGAIAGSSASPPLMRSLSFTGIASHQRGRRRRNMADEDEVRGRREAGALGPSPGPPATGLSSAARSYLSATGSIGGSARDASSHPQTMTPVYRPSLGARCFLRALWFPYMGWMAAKMAEGLAYASYIGGSFTILERVSPAIQTLTSSELCSGADAERNTTISPHSNNNSSVGVAPASPQTTSLGTSAAWPVDALYVGCSRIHGRGLFTAVPLPCGTPLPLGRSVAARNASSSSSCAADADVVGSASRFFVPAHTHLMLLSDTYDRLPDTLHYSLPIGKVLELITSNGQSPEEAALTGARVGGASRDCRRTSSSSGSLSPCWLNHSCSANVCSGLSPVFWAAALQADAITGTTTWGRRLRTFHRFADANQFFVTRDVAAHEELTLDYGCRVAPLYAVPPARLSLLAFAGMFSRKQRSGGAGRRRNRGPVALCRCGAVGCRRRLFEPPAPAPSLSLPTAARKEKGARVFDAAVELLARGYDEELAILSLLPSAEPLVAYLSGKPIPELQGCRDGGGTSPLPPRLVPHRVSKSIFLSSYRYVFKGLNNVAPRSPPPPPPPRTFVLFLEENSKMLCNVDRYAQQGYLSTVPPPTRMEAAPASAVDLTLSGATRLQQLQTRHQQEPHKEPVPVDAAADQSLVDQFFLDAASPLYGPRAPPQRLQEVYQVLHKKLGVEPRPALPGETREQYWRRLAAYYIEHYEVCHNNDTAPRPDGETEGESNAFGDPFYIIDFGRVMEQMARWRAALPMVRPYYAVKCNPFQPLLELLAALGAGFDCASKGEMELVKDLVEDRPHSIIFANPCKRIGDLQTAVRLGVRYTTFDNEEELEKIAQHLPEAKAVLRLATDDSAAVCAFSTKFGARRDVVPRLLQRAAALKVSISGVSFHVGSGNSDPSAYLAALRDAKETFALARQYGHLECNLLDIGGGYPGAPPGHFQPHSSASKKQAGEGSVSFEAIAAAMRPVLEKDFSGMTIISEPGRFFTEASHALLMHVYARRIVAHTKPDGTQENEYQYYVNDGLYHSFNCILYDHAHPHLLLLKDNEPVEGGQQVPRALHLTSIFGPTCDSLDCILKQQPFPEMRVGDWLLAPDMGSYTTAAGCPFNGISTKRRVYVTSITL
eukprot:gene12130-8351_t